MKAETTVNGPQASSKTVLTGNAAGGDFEKESRERDCASEIDFGGGILMASAAGNGKCQLESVKAEDNAWWIGNAG